MSVLPTSFSFESVERLDETVHGLGWDTEYRQLDPGRFKSRFTVFVDDNFFLMEEQSFAKVEIAAPVEKDLCVLALMAGEDTVVGGQLFTPDHIYLLAPGTDNTGTVPAGVKIIQVGVAAEAFEELMHAVAPELGLQVDASHLLATTPGLLAGLRRDMSIALKNPSPCDAIRNETVSNILTHFITVAADHAGIGGRNRLHRVPAQRSLERAKEYIDANLDSAIRIAAMCRYARSNLRTLQRIFVREVGMTPQQYVKVRRLNAAHRQLLAAERGQGLNVTEVAMGLGFNHLSRFSGEYQRHFGEYPQETLHAQ